MDSAATALKPKVVIEAIKSYYTTYSLNTHSESDNVLFKNINKEIKKTRSLIIKCIKGDKEEEIVFVPSATYAINLLSLACEPFIKKGDQIALTFLEHSSNCSLRKLGKEEKSWDNFSSFKRRDYRHKPPK